LILAGWPLPGGPKEGRKEKENDIYREGGLAIKCPNQNLSQIDNGCEIYGVFSDTSPT